MTLIPLLCRTVNRFEGILYLFAYALHLNFVDSVNNRRCITILFRSLYNNKQKDQQQQKTPNGWFCLAICVHMYGRMVIAGEGANGVQKWWPQQQQQQKKKRKRFSISKRMDWTGGYAQRALDREIGGGGDRELFSTRNNSMSQTLIEKPTRPTNLSPIVTSE